jgi:IS5 family transposase
MLLLHLMQQWYDLSETAMEDVLIEIAAMRRITVICRSRTASSTRCLRWERLN